jgi:hypothetical protein
MGGVIVPVLRAVRLRLACARLGTGVFGLLLAVVSWQVSGKAQTAADNSADNSKVAQTQVAASADDSPGADQTASPEQAGTAAAQSPTAGQIVTGAEKDAADDPEAKPAALTHPASMQPASLPVGGNHPPAKYDVSMIGQRNVGAGLDFYSLDREIALGRTLAHQVEGSARLVTDPVVNEYVNRIGQNLVRNSDARVPFTIKVLDTDEVNAFALPGGFFYVNSGLILAADNEAELAGVMAHEIAHVAARHATKNMTRAQIWNIASIPLIFVGGPVAYAISEIASIAVPLGFLKFSRDAEREADLLGLEYDYAAGYDPQAFVQFFEKLKVDEKKKRSVVAKAFATHPMNADRIKAAQDEIRQYLPDRPEYVVDTSEFESVKERLMGLENGERLVGGKSGRGPVLLRRAGSSGSSDSGEPSDQNDDRPVLKRKDAGGDSTQAANQSASSTADPKDDGRPTLKNNTPN